MRDSGHHHLFESSLKSSLFLRPVKQGIKTLGQLRLQSTLAGNVYSLGFFLFVLFGFFFVFKPNQTQSCAHIPPEM